MLRVYHDTWLHFKAHLRNKGCVIRDKTTHLTDECVFNSEMFLTSRFYGIMWPFCISSLVFSHLLLPWLKSLPKLLEELAASSPEVSSLVIDSLVTAGPYMTLVQFEDSFLSLNGMSMF